MAACACACFLGGGHYVYVEMGTGVAGGARGSERDLCIYVDVGGSVLFGSRSGMLAADRSSERRARAYQKESLVAVKGYIERAESVSVFYVQIDTQNEQCAR